MAPLCFAVLKGLTPPEIQTELYDERIEDIPEHLDTDLVAISIQTFTARRGYQIAGQFRERGTPVVMGGYHATFLPEEARQHADAVVVGEAEGVWSRLLEDLQNHRLKQVYQSEVKDLETVDYDASIFTGKKYAPLFPVEYNRGCKFTCDFCSTSAFHQHKYKYRPVDKVVSEIQRSGKKNVFIVDDNVFNRRDRMEQLIDALIPLKVTWTCQISINITRHKDLLAKMRLSGCSSVFIGFESISNDNIANMQKGINRRHSDYSAAIRRVQKCGIMVHGSFIFGYDDDVHSFKNTVDFAIKNKLFLAYWNILNPMPGTGAYRKLLAANQLPDEHWWLRPGAIPGEVFFKSTQLSAGELKDGCIWAMKRFYGMRSIAWRFLEWRSHLLRPLNALIYLVSNVLTRLECRRRIQDLRKSP